MSEAEGKYSESLVSQETLDELMKEAEDQPQPANVDDETADLDLVSPEDIEKLLETSSAGADNNEDESELDLISQDDIDSLISGEELSGVGSSDSGDLDDELISQDDIDSLLGGADSLESSDSGGGEDSSEDSLISQDDIDALLSGGDALTDNEDRVEIISDDPDDSDASLISQEDIDSLLNDVGSSEDTAEEQLVTQEDIESLLANDDVAEKPEAVVDTGEKLVSQEDIDKLLNADIDDDVEESEDAIEAVVDQVILENSDDDQVEEGKKDLKKWLTNKVVIGCTVAALVLIVAGVGFVIFSGSSDTEIVEMDVVEEAQDEVVVSLDEEISEIQDLTEDVFVIVELKDFVVPAPLAMKDISYISLDLSLEIVDVTSDPIKGYEPFFRNIIYEVLNRALELQSESRVIEADLVRMIKKALNDALSEGSINKVSFVEFNIT